MRILDVAQRAGVSVATVSRVLNGTDSVKAEYRDRVLEAVAELGYRPNLLARNLRRQKTSAIGVLVSDIENPHFTQMVRVMEDAAYRNGHRVLLCNTDETAEKQHSYLRVLAAERVVGVILSPTDPADPEISNLLDLGIPVVALDRQVNDPRADAVLANNIEATGLATRHLIEAGHTHIGFVAGKESTETGVERLAGYRAAMVEAGLVPLFVSGDFRLEGGRAASEQLLSTRPAPTALIVANNLMAIGTLEAIRKRKLRVPDDVALVGIDDPFWAEIVEPPITTLAQPLRAMAEASISLLLDRINGSKRAAQRLVFDFDLRVRGSSRSQGSTSAYD